LPALQINSNFAKNNLIKNLNIMKGLILGSVFTVGSIIFLSSCGGGTSETNTANENKPKEEVKAVDVSGLTAQLQMGEKIYKEKCFVCHQLDAKGIPGQFPPLAGSDYLLADPKRGIAQTLNGSNMEIIVNGTSYKTPMTPQVQTKEQAVAVINYVLKTFNGYTDDKLLKIKDAEGIVINPIKL
jgi:nitrite reductase (NO-forming)